MLGKSFLPAYGHFRDEDFSGDEMTGICVETSGPELSLSDKVKEMQADGCSIEEIRKKLTAINLEEEQIEQLLAGLGKLSIRSKLTS